HRVGCNGCREGGRARRGSARALLPAYGAARRGHTKQAALPRAIEPGRRSVTEVSHPRVTLLADATRSISIVRAAGGLKCRMSQGLICSCLSPERSVSSR